MLGPEFSLFHDPNSWMQYNSSSVFASGEMEPDFIHYFSFSSNWLFRLVFAFTLEPGFWDPPMVGRQVLVCASR
jgi:hypothetical protein